VDHKTQLTAMVMTALIAKSEYVRAVGQIAFPMLAEIRYAVIGPLYELF
jgi:hypothetical protein